MNDNLEYKYNGEQDSAIGNEKFKTLVETNLHTIVRDLFAIF